jgi:hypothetical protein
MRQRSVLIPTGLKGVRTRFRVELDHEKVEGRDAGYRSYRGSDDEGGGEVGGLGAQVVLYVNTLHSHSKKEEQHLSACCYLQDKIGTGQLHCATDRCTAQDRANFSCKLHEALGKRPNETWPNTFLRHLLFVSHPSTNFCNHNTRPPTCPQLCRSESLLPHWHPVLNSHFQFPFNCDTCLPQLRSRFLHKNFKIKIYKIIILPVVLYGCETWSLTLRKNTD